MLDLLNWLKKNNIFKFVGTLVISVAIFWIILLWTKNYFSGAFEISDNYYVAISQVLGGLLGGIFTLIGVWWTLIIQSKERKEDLIQAEERQKEQNRLQNLPVFQYKIDNENKSKSGTVYMFNCSKDDEAVCIPLNICIKNIGLGAAQHIYYQLYIDNKHQGTKQGLVNSLIQINDTIEDTYYIYVRKEETSLIAKLIVYYDDLIGNHYVQELDGALTKFYSTDTNTNIAEINFNMNFPTIKDYLIVDNDYNYEIPKETIDMYEMNKAYSKRIEEFTKLDEYKDIEKLVNKFVKDNETDIFNYLPNCYKNIKFMGGSGITDITEDKDKKEYLVTFSVNTIQTINAELNYMVALKVNLNTNKIYINDIKLVKHTIKSNWFKHKLANIQFSLHMHTQKKIVNKGKKE